MAARTAKKATAKATAAKSGNGGNGNNNLTVVPEKPASAIGRKAQEAGGIAKITLGELRDELGHARIGKMVLLSMAEYLTNNKLGFFPAWVLSEENTEPRQWQEVWVYERDGSAKSVVLDAVSDPDNKDLVAALNMFSQDTPDYSQLDSDQKMSLVKHILEA